MGAVALGIMLRTNASPNMYRRQANIGAITLM
jgi:hypothetical protein